MSAPSRDPELLAEENAALRQRLDALEREAADASSRGTQVVSHVQVLADLAAQLQDAQDEDRVFALFAQRLLQVSGGESIINVSVVEPSQGTYSPRVLLGLGPYMDRLIKLLGKRPEDLRGDYTDSVKSAMATGRLTRVAGGVAELAGNALPSAICLAAAAMLGIQEVWVIGFRRGSAAGGVSILTRRPGPLPASLIETITTLCAIAIARVRSEKELRDREAKYRHIFDNVGETILVAQDGVIKMANRNAEALSGYALSELVSKPFSGFVHPDDRQLVMERHLERLRGELESVAKYESRLLHKSGEPRWVQISTSLTQWEGRPATINFLLDLTERKLAEDALRDRNLFVSSLLQAVPWAVFYKDRQGRYLGCNSAFTKVMGVTDEQIRGKTVHELWPSAHAEMYHRMDLELMRTGRHQVYEYEVRAWDGRVMPVIYSKDIFVDKDGEVAGLVGAFLDITAHKRAEEALRASENKYRELVENSYDIIYSLTREGVFRFVSPAWTRMLGHPVAQVEGRPYTEFIHPDDVPACASFIQRVVQTGERQEGVQYRVRHADGSWRWHTSSASPHRDATGVVTQYDGISRDITARKCVEEALRLDEERLEVLLALNTMTGASERELTHFAMEAAVRLTNSTIGYVAFMDPDETVLTMQAWSKHATRECGIADKPLVYPVASTGLWGEAVRQRKPVITNDFEAPNPWKKGTPAGHVRVTRHMNVPTFDGARIVIVAGVGNKQGEYGDDDVRQISLLMSGLWTIIRRKRAEEEKAKLQEQLVQAQKMESVGRLAGGVAHDFNNMLGAILGHTELAMESLEPGQPLYEDLRQIRSAAERSANLTRQLLAFARRQTVAPRVLELNETVDGMLKMLRRLIGEDVQVAWLPGRDTGMVRIDPSQVDQLLANLCVNARDAIAGTGRVTIETGRASFDEDFCAQHAGVIPGQYVWMAVSDDGCGMDDETKSHLFEPFFTTKEIGKGTGLGLATVFGIVKQNNGFLNVYSEPGKGTTIKVYLPRHTVDHPLPGPGAAPAAVPGSGTVLLVEDDPAIQRVTARMLQRLGYTVIAASTPAEAMRLAQEHSGRIDLLLTDVIMPEMNGRDLAGRVLSVHPESKRLFMSGYTADVIAHHGVLDEGVHFLQKPFSATVLAAKVREVLQGR